MPSVEERVAYLERRLEDHPGAVSDLRSGMADLRGAMTDLRGAITDMRSSVTGVRSALTHLDQKVDRHFTWLVGIQVAVLVAIVGTLVGSYYK